MKRAVVTGAGGFLGSALCKVLIERGVFVVAVVRETTRELMEAEQRGELRVVESDLSDYVTLDRRITDRDIDALYHFAWAGTSGRLRGDAAVQLDNVRHTCDLAETACRMGIRRLIFAASVMEYEIDAAFRGDYPLGRNDLYAAAKRAANYMAGIVAEAGGMEYIAAVISNIYGPGEKSARLINTSIRKWLRDEHVAFSAGDQIYDFIYIDDAAEIFYLLGETDQPKRICYIGSETPKPLKEYLETMYAQISPAQEIGLGERAFDGVSLTYREFDRDAVRRATGYRNRVDFGEGIRRTAVWIQETDGR